MKFVSEPITKVGPNEAVVIANDTTSKLSVATGLVFYESGRYDISIQGNVVTVSKAPSEWPQATWEWDDDDNCWRCSNCKAVLELADLSSHYYSFCYKCGHHMTLEYVDYVRRKVYECDPNKNTTCNKTTCFINGGDCKLTFDPNCAKENEDNGSNSN